MQKQLFYGSYTNLEPTDVLTVNQLFLIQKLVKKGFTDKEIYIKFELHQRPYIVAYCMRLRRK